MREVTTSDWASSPTLTSQTRPFESLTSYPLLCPLVSRPLRWNVSSGAVLGAGGPLKRSREDTSAGFTQRRVIGSVAVFSLAASAPGGKTRSSAATSGGMNRRSPAGGRQRDAGFFMTLLP